MRHPGPEIGRRQPFQVEKPGRAAQMRLQEGQERAQIAAIGVNGVPGGPLFVDEPPLPILDRARK